MTTSPPAPAPEAAPSKAARAVVLTGGWMHPPEQCAALFELLRSRYAVVDIVDQPTAVAASLDAPVDMLVVNACWFAMQDDRYTVEQRSEHAVVLDDVTQQAIVGVLDSGTPLLALHTAVLCFDGWPRWVSALGAEWDWSTSFHPPPAAMTVEPVADHPLLSEPFTLVDEEYQGLRVDSTATLVAQSDAGHPLVWTTDHGPGRVAVSLLGHGPTSLSNEAHQSLLNHLIEWLTNNL